MAVVQKYRNKVQAVAYVVIVFHMRYINEINCNFMSNPCNIWHTFVSSFVGKKTELKWLLKSTDNLLESYCEGIGYVGK